MNHTLSIYLLPPDGGLGEYIAEYPTPEELLLKRPEIAQTEGAVEMVLALKIGDAKHLTPSYDVWCADVVTPEEYTEVAMVLGREFHDALIVLARAVEFASGDADVTCAMRDAVSFGIHGSSRASSALATTLKGRVFEPKRGKPMTFERWCQRAADRTRIGAGPAVLRADALELTRNMGLVAQDPS